MAPTLTPTPPVLFTIYRLRQSVAETSRFSDQDLLDIINDGYRSACQRSECLQAAAVLTVSAGFSEALLPADWSSTIRVYVAGAALEPVSYQHATMRLPGTYYQYEGRIGLLALDPDTDSDTSVLMLYARTPDDLGYEDVPEWGAEWNYLLRHYAAWRCILASGGAQTISKAVQERRMFENGVRNLRHQNRPGRPGDQRIRHVSELRRSPIAG